MCFRVLKRCANPTCTMVFYDTGKNSTRRWCRMSICGNHDKVARYRSHKSDGARRKRQTFNRLVAAYDTVCGQVVFAHTAPIYSPLAG